MKETEIGAEIALHVGFGGISDKFSLGNVGIVEVKDGVLWVLATRKLARYDGANWEVFENPHNLP